MLRVIIPSLGRPDILPMHPLLEHADVALHETEVDAYREAFKAAGREPARIHSHRIIGIGATFAFLFEKAWPGADGLLIAGDDLTCVWNIMGFGFPRHYDAEYMLSVAEHVALAAEDAGARLAGFSQTADPRERRASIPFTLRRWVSSAGMIVLDPTLRPDPELHVTGEDVDLSLQAIQKNRIVWGDQRWFWEHGRYTAGGLSRIRTAEGVKANYEYLQRKWGESVVVPMPHRRKTGQGDRIKID